MSKEIAQKMNYQEREALKTFTERCALRDDMQSLQMTLRMITHWMRQPIEIDFSEYASQWTAAQAERGDGNHSTFEMAEQWPLTTEMKISHGCSDYMRKYL
ncbi:MAG: hypothetical protein XXXJIFNMEKO3_00616 [Candidatus Erwinia impunctatus]|nr:hypothetical protein XXXJIFNMEKO_00616 [Culicoides impunctatus]